MIKIYAEPTRELIVPDWPSGRRCVEARFWIETDACRGERVCRQTTGKPKRSTYALRCAIVTGDDGRTYFLWDSGTHVTVYRANMKDSEETRFAGDPGYDDLIALLDDAAEEG